MRLCSFQRVLWRDTRGAVLIYVTVGLTVLLGGAALVIDAGRLYTMNSELQAAADAFALTCAAELDRTADSEVRAGLAVANLVTNSDTYSTTATSNVVAGTPVFLSFLPADSAALSTATVSTDPSETRFCQITVNAKSIDTYFVQVFSGQTTKSTTAVAVAGFDSAVCGFTPLFICNPFEFGGEFASIQAAVADPAFRRRLFKLAILGGADQPSAGNFRFLESPLGPGAAQLADTLAVAAPNTCFIETGVDTKTGANTGPVRTALNVRFDMYRGSFASKKNVAAYRPAMNVRKGWPGTPDCMTAAAVVTNNPPNIMGLPRDDCYDAADSAFPYANLAATDARMGTGDWDFEAYWTTNHAFAAPFGWNNGDGNRPSRYEVYREEIDSSTYTDVSPDGETGEAECYGGATAPNDSPDRRIIYAAILDCTAELGPGANTGVPVEAWVKMFITEPVASVDGDPANTKDAIYIEMVDVLDPGEDDDVLHDIVQLYR
jgi:Flp pilus assembly protein TadG